MPPTTEEQRRFAEIEPLVVDRAEDAGPVDPEIYKEYKRLLVELQGTKRGA